MNKIEKEILAILNPTAQEAYDHKFTSLKDTCSDPNPPYTMRITPLYHYFSHYYKVMAQVSMFHDDEVEIFTEEQMDYLIKNSPLHYLYPAEKQTYSDADTYHNLLLVAIDNYERVKLTDDQYKFLIQNSDLSVGKNEGSTPLILALHRNHSHLFDLNAENWNLLKKSARDLNIEYVNKWKNQYNLHDDYFIMYPQIADELRTIIREQHILASKEELDSSLGSNSEKKKTIKM